ncbi:type IV fimbrial biogenesis PilW-like protein [Legionella quinlivanii]|uniref:Type IV fimbrial biogenesis PilW-like protein n=1 Tax=Legionella quinlivanii TaxID=45073 RepID=A0A0W0XXD3_9GAMM|nr:PilW family protein [Legionella quinlivanii]KTD49135.1 type IV fimbrial biogenesis PilW-like protein [Legionella quinlivanii]SEG43244.1 type IV pilus assembly protein PilW [Legionella quinlivanii DSM 21216]STY11645.1 type IV pilus assembly protein PilW [Legionella quinlivanii]
MSSLQRNEQGFSIIEFMIAISLGTLLVASISIVYLSNKTTFVIQDALARLQENGRYADYMLSYDLRMAGYQGCANQRQVKVTNLIKNLSTMLDYDKPLRGYDGAGSTFSPGLPANLQGKSVPGSDVIEIRKASSLGVQLRDDMNRPNNPILVYDRMGITAGTPLMITDCSVGDLFIAGSNSNATAITHSSNQNTSNDLSVAYLRTAQIAIFDYYSYYIKDTGRVNAQNQAILALVRQDRNGNEDEIAEGIEQMRISYGVDTNGDNTVDTYQTAAQVQSGDNWNNVISVQINLLLATVENVADKAMSYSYNGSNLTPGDRKLRREWTIFVTLRNRGLPL